MLAFEIIGRTGVSIQSAQRIATQSQNLGDSSVDFSGVVLVTPLFCNALIKALPDVTPINLSPVCKSIWERVSANCQRMKDDANYREAVEYMQNKYWEEYDG